MAGIGLGACVAAGIAIAPAIGAAGQAARVAPQVADRLPTLGGFTPAAADPRLAAVLARGGLDGNGFRFTPAESSRTNRAVTVAVRARSSRGALVADRGTAAPASVSLAPIAYNLGVSVGWKKFAVTGDLAKVDLAGAPGSRNVADLGLSYVTGRTSARLKATSERPLEDAPRLVADTPATSLDLGGSYSLSRNLDVTAGVRYRTERDRLRPVDDRRDSQAVYIGTAFRF
ncbi:porin [Sphingomonas aracearum]|uniref:Porin n=1 Tax=Sphingomonas aracearum TaxID=2283317 RepID=A0A369VVE8_9SPHN|nr:porin [Sphingomonas aracearum]